MIARLEKIKSGELNPTEHDLRFYTHELREYVRYRKQGYEFGNPENLWEHTHAAPHFLSINFTKGTNISYFLMKVFMVSIFFKFFVF
jgi:hypothetical protein